MPVPETYSRRLGNVREETYSYRSSNRPSILSTYTSKYSSTLPPRPPAYERKISELNTSSTAGSRFLNGSATTTRSGSSYGTSAYTRSSVSPARATTSSLRRSLEGSNTSGTGSLADRLRSVDLGEKEPVISSSGYKYLTRNRDSSSVGPNRSSYGSYSRERSGSRELASSPLTTSPITLGSRGELKSEIMRSRSSSNTGSNVGLGTTSASPASSPTSTLGYGRASRLSSSNGLLTTRSGTEVTKSSVVSSGSETTSATPTNSVVSKSKIEGDLIMDRDVENNDDPCTSSSSSTALDRSASLSHNDEVVSLNMNGNDTVTHSGKDTADVEGRSDCVGNGDWSRPRKKSSSGSESNHVTTILVVDKDSNGNPISPPNNLEHAPSKDNCVFANSLEFRNKTCQDESNSSASQTVPSAVSKTKLKGKSESDSNANVLDTKKSTNKSNVGSLNAAASTTTTSSITNLNKKPEIGVKKSFLKPNPLSSTKVQSKSKVIIHKFKVEDTSEERQSNKSPAESKRNSAEPPSLDDSKPSSASTSRKSSTEDSRHGNASVTVTLSPRKALSTTNAETKISKISPPRNIVDGDSNSENSNSNDIRRLSSGSGRSQTSLSATLGIKRESSPLSGDEDQTTATATIKLPADQIEPQEKPKHLQDPSSVSKSRSPSPLTSVTVTLSPPKRLTTLATASTPSVDSFENSNSGESKSDSKVPTPPPLPTLSVNSNSDYTPRFRSRKSEDNVTTDGMAGPHSSKYASLRQGKTDPERTSTEREQRGPRNTAYVNSTSDSSDNDSEDYSRSPPTGGRFRTRDAEKAGLTGLRNIGNTCFMNSVVQCLSNTKPLLEYVNQDNYSHDINTSTSSMKGALMRAFTQVIQELWRETRPVDTSAFKDQIQRFAPRFMGYSQQDAQEFLRYLLEGLHEDVNRVTMKPKPILTDIDDSLSDSQKAAESWKRYLRYDDSKIVDIFVGQLKSTLKCTTCGHCSVTFDPFWDLSLPIPPRASSTKLGNCFELFTREEVLDGDEKPTCSKCQCRRKCTKSLSIQKFPRILVIHLKRFSPNERYRGKLSTSVEYPLKGLDLTNFSANPSQAFSPVTTNSVVSSEGYVLFYEMASQSSHL